MPIRIITDSSSDLPEEVVRRLDVTVVPLKVTFDKETFLEGVDLTPNEFFERLADFKGLPKTSQPSPDDFRKAIDDVMSQGHEPLVLTLASALSGTYDSARLAAEPYGGRVTVIDSHNGTMGLGLLVMRAVEMIRQGLPKNAIVKRIQDLKDRMHTLVALNTLENVVKGGRLPRIAGAVASVLNLKPIITKLPGGHIALLESVRGRRRSLQRVVELMAKHVRDWPATPVGIAHADCADDANELKGMIEAAYSPKEVLVGLMGSTIGTYAGLGGLTVSF